MVPLAATGESPPRAFYAGSAVQLAPRLLGAWLVNGDCAGRIVEVEAYEPDDPASHSFPGPRPRNRTMFGPPGHLYVYRSYGIHWCANVVCGPVGVGAAVLVRAVEPVCGLAVMAARRGTDVARSLCSGPGRLCQAFGISGTDDGTDLCQGGPLRLVAAAGEGGASAVVQTTRIGISKATERPWRWLEAGNPHVSRRAAVTVAPVVAPEAAPRRRGSASR